MNNHELVAHARILIRAIEAGNRFAIRAVIDEHIAKIESAYMACPNPRLGLKLIAAADDLDHAAVAAKIA
jgi:hypothetical protein